ncbi:MAG: hypothetical protein ACE5HX_15650 [bacterium]
MGKIGVWKPEPEEKAQKQKAKVKEKQSAEKSFWETCISEKRDMTFRFVDSSEASGKLLAYDNYFLLVEIDGKQRLIHKGGLLWVE